MANTGKPDFEISQNSSAQECPRPRGADQPPPTNATKARCRPEAATNETKAADWRFNRVTKCNRDPPAQNRTETGEKHPCPGDRDKPAARWTSDTAEPPHAPSPPGPKAAKTTNSGPERPPEEEEPSEQTTQRHHPRPGSRSQRHCQRVPPQLCNPAKGRRCVIQRMVNGR